jgi:hypothetical protein
VTVQLAAPLPRGRQLRDVATERVVITADAAIRDRFALPLLAYDLRALVVE